MDQVDVMEILKNNLIVVRISHQLQERLKLVNAMKGEFCLTNYKNYKEELKTLQQQIVALNNEF